MGLMHERTSLNDPVRLLFSRVSVSVFVYGFYAYACHPQCPVWLLCLSATDGPEVLHGSLHSAALYGFQTNEYLPQRHRSDPTPMNRGLNSLGRLLSHMSTGLSILVCLLCLLVSASVALRGSYAYEYIILSGLLGFLSTYESASTSL